jgi:hypothetical protein
MHRVFFVFQVVYGLTEVVLGGKMVVTGRQGEYERRRGVRDRNYFDKSTTGTIPRNFVTFPQTLCTVWRTGNFPNCHRTRHYLSKARQWPWIFFCRCFLPPTPPNWRLKTIRWKFVFAWNRPKNPNLFRGASREKTFKDGIIGLMVVWKPTELCIFGLNWSFFGFCPPPLLRLTPPGRWISTDAQDPIESIGALNEFTAQFKHLTLHHTLHACRMICPMRWEILSGNNLFSLHWQESARRVDLRGEWSINSAASIQNVVPTGAEGQYRVTADGSQWATVAVSEHGFISLFYDVNGQENEIRGHLVGNKVEWTDGDIWTRVSHHCLLWTRGSPHCF